MMTFQPKPGMILAGKYKLIVMLGQGGMGVVWLAECILDLGLPERKHVVVKFVRQDLRNTKFLAYFRREAAIAMIVQDSTLVATYDAGVHQSVPYYVMEWVRGLSVDSIIDSREWQTTDQRYKMQLTCHCIYQVMHALRLFHSLETTEGKPMGLVHRDVSASNVFASLTGDIRLGDFGIARSAYHYDLEQSQVGFKGKVQYMCRLHLLGDDLDPRVDLYACGAILYEMIAGENFRSRSLTRLEMQNLAQKGDFPALPSWVEPWISSLYSNIMSLEIRSANEVIDIFDQQRIWNAKNAIGKLASWITKQRPTQTGNFLSDALSRGLDNQQNEQCPKQVNLEAPKIATVSTHLEATTVPRISITGEPVPAVQALNAQIHFASTVLPPPERSPNEESGFVSPPTSYDEAERELSPVQVPPEQEHPPTSTSYNNRTGQTLLTMDALPSQEPGFLPASASHNHRTGRTLPPTEILPEPGVLTPSVQPSKGARDLKMRWPLLMIPLGVGAMLAGGLWGSYGVGLGTQSLEGDTEAAEEIHISNDPPALQTEFAPENLGVPAANPLFTPTQVANVSHVNIPKAVVTAEQRAPLVST